MAITLVISKGPASRASLRSAELAKALVNTGQALERVFFHADGVLLCRSGLDARQDPFGAAALWQSLIREHRLPSTACSGSASRRQETDAPPLAENIELAGLGQLADALQHSERLVSF